MNIATANNQLRQLRRLTKRLAVPFLYLLGIGNIVYSVTRCGAGHGSSSASLARGPIPPANAPPVLARAVRRKSIKGVATTARRVETARKHHKVGNPSLIIHVGPTNMFASELVEDLKTISSELAEDKIVLADRTTTSLITDFECHKALNEARREYENASGKGERRLVSTLKEHLVSTVPCWKHATVALDLHKKRGESLVVVDEKLSKRVHDFQGLRLAPLDFIALESMNDEWNIEVVVGYRRLAEWLPDAVEEYSHDRHSKALSVEQRVPEPLFPTILQQAKKANFASINATYSDGLVDRYAYRKEGESKIPVTLFNVHAGPLGKTLACAILPSAKHACIAAKQRLSERKTVRSYPAQVEDFYEFFVEDAGKRSAYRRKSVTPDVAAIAVKHYQETVLKKSAADLPTKCPNKSTLKGLLKLSLEYEKRILPEYAQGAQQAHRRDFWDAAKTSNRLCHIDNQKLLRDVKWRGYVRLIPHDVPKELLPRHYVVKASTQKKVKSIFKGGRFFGSVTMIRNMGKKRVS